ncbi:MAG: hypothetical protein GVY33_09670, partial [Alphaproteobacteria bacterium]|nr:hypothetical protein [Alphaproteobacteria bacterium]
MDHKRAIAGGVAPAAAVVRLGRRLLGGLRAQRERRLLAVPIPLALGIA